MRYNQKNGGHLKNGTELSASPRPAAARASPRDPAASTRGPVGGWFYPQAEVRTTVSLPQLGLCDDDGPDGVKNQGNQQGEWFWCDSRMEIS